MPAVNVGGPSRWKQCLNYIARGERALRPLRQPDATSSQQSTGRMIDAVRFRSDLDRGVVLQVWPRLYTTLWSIRATIIGRVKSNGGDWTNRWACILAAPSANPVHFDHLNRDFFVQKKTHKIRDKYWTYVRWDITSSLKSGGRRQMVMWFVFESIDSFQSAHYRTVVTSGYKLCVTSYTDITDTYRAPSRSATYVHTCLVEVRYVVAFTYPSTCKWQWHAWSYSTVVIVAQYPPHIKLYNYHVHTVDGSWNDSIPSWVDRYKRPKG